MDRADDIIRLGRTERKNPVIHRLFVLASGVTPIGRQTGEKCQRFGLVNGETGIFAGVIRPLGRLGETVDGHQTTVLDAEIALPCRRTMAE